MKKLGFALAAGMAMLAVAIITAMAVPSGSATVEAKKTEDAVLEFTIDVPADASVGKTVDVVRKAANIGSSGQDGFAVDSFFDITYMVSPGGGGTIKIVIHAAPNSPDINPGTVIDNVRAAVGGKGGYIGHVTLLK
ncbi:MAG: hypothetical protein QF898_06210 [SAR202 cluster bacterium]|jgi:hypothetical protein|nr:hypothetical protein [SAR202 cluster bacterium]MDP6714179.1 hypothetical protein [SAR202 cluster bacterium]